jgi:alkylated DNA nucleotide flippase Atl1
MAKASTRLSAQTTDLKEYRVWTRARVAQVIKSEFGVTYTPRHVGRILDDLNRSLQKPVIRASQRDEEAIQRWTEERWSEIPKKAAAEGYTIVFVDEAGFYLLPMAVRTYAPVGETPLITCRLTRDHLSTISGITLQGKLYMMAQGHSLKSPDVVRFLQHLLRHIPGKILVLWDGAPIHRGQVVKDFLTNGGSERIWLERLPGYAPELNPDEGV